MNEKPLPSDLQAERATLGSVFLDRDCIIALTPWLEPTLFYLERHVWIYAAQQACYDRRVPPDLVNVADELRRHDRLDAVGGTAYLIELSNSVPTAYHVEYYGRIVERTGVLRRLIQAGSVIARLGYDEAADLDVVLDRAEAQISRIRERQARDGFGTLADAVESLSRRGEALRAAGETLAGVGTGFRDLDDQLSGLQRSDVILLAARPAVGKTAMALSIAYNIARRGGHVAFCSLEMSREQLAARLVAIHAGLEVQQLLSGDIVESELDAALSAFGAVSELPISIAERSAACSIGQIRSLTRALHVTRPVELVVVDYIQLVEAQGGNREQEVAAVSRGLKALAAELDVPVLALSQLNRAVETRAGSHVPTLSDLRESGSLEQDASVVMFIYREELYEPETDKRGIAEIHISKNRNGPPGVVPLRFFPETTKFADLERYHGPEGY